MTTRNPLWLLLLTVTVLALLLSPVACYRRREEVEEEEEERTEGRRGYGRREGEDLFLLQDSRRVIQTDAGEMRVVRTFGGRIIEKPVHIGFITMEPKSLFIPQYLDSSLILFVRRGICLFPFFSSQLSNRLVLLHVNMYTMASSENVGAHDFHVLVLRRI